MLVVLLVKCGSVYNKAIELWNLVDTCTPDVVIGTESWINPLNAELNPICHLLALLGTHHILHVSRIRVKGDTSNVEVFTADFTTFGKDRCLPSWLGFYLFNNFIASTELCVDDDFEMITFEVKEMDPKYTWEIIGIYRAPNEDTLVIEGLAARTLLT